MSSSKSQSVASVSGGDRVTAAPDKFWAVEVVGGTIFLTDGETWAASFNVNGCITTNDNTGRVKDCQAWQQDDQGEPTKREELPGRLECERLKDLWDGVKYLRETDMEPDRWQFSQHWRWLIWSDYLSSFLIEPTPLSEYPERRRDEIPKLRTHFIPFVLGLTMDDTSMEQ